MLKLCKPSVICLLLVGAASSAPLIASSINTYDITFAGLANPAGIAATTGSFTYDSATQTFTNFIIDWDGIAFDFTASANAPVLGATGCDGESESAAYTFLLLTQNVTCGTNTLVPYPDPDYRWAALAIYQPIDNNSNYAWVDKFDIQLIRFSGNMDYLEADSSGMVTGGNNSDYIGVTFREVACSPNPDSPICAVAAGGGNEGASLATTWTVTSETAPEPATIGLFLSGLAGAGLLAAGDTPPTAKRSRSNIIAASVVIAIMEPSGLLSSIHSPG